jgi:glycosyltransferase involved in cell wall biosynthesis
VMTPEVAMLAEPEPVALADAICELIEHPDTRARLADSARSLVAREYSPAAFQRRASHILDRIEQQLKAAH